MVESPVVCGYLCVNLTDWTWLCRVQLSALWRWVFCGYENEDLYMASATYAYLNGEIVPFDDAKGQ